jgi:hypothetical protein
VKSLAFYQQTLKRIAFDVVRSYWKRRQEIKNDKLLWRAATTKHEFFSV